MKELKNKEFGKVMTKEEIEDYKNKNTDDSKSYNRSAWLRRIFLQDLDRSTIFFMSLSLILLFIINEPLRKGFFVILDSVMDDFGGLHHYLFLVIICLLFSVVPVCIYFIFLKNKIKNKEEETKNISFRLFLLFIILSSLIAFCYLFFLFGPMIFLIWIPFSVYYFFSKKEINFAGRAIVPLIILFNFLIGMSSALILIIQGFGSGWLLIFPILNILGAIISALALSHFADKGYYVDISNKPVKILRCLPGIIVGLIILFFLNFKGMHWVITYSICLSYATLINGIIDNAMEKMIH